ncbi:crotonyl-CoA carboxylase/reductase [Lachnospiraceae bacterium ZAX-1]
MKRSEDAKDRVTVMDNIPTEMYAWTLREGRLGEPKDAFKLESVPIPSICDNEVLVRNMATGVNYNGVWAALGKPRNVVKAHHRYEEKQDFMICGSESSGIICAVGKSVKRFKVGDEVICLGVQYDSECDVYKKFNDARVSTSFRIWGYEGNWGSYAQYSKVMELQCIHKPKSLTWQEAAACTATGATVYNMLTHWEGNKIQKGDVVLVWGGAGGLGSSAIPLIKELGGIAVAVVSSEERGERCLKIGANGYVNRSNFNHWGPVPGESLENKDSYNHWLKNAIKFKRSIQKAAGVKQDPRIVLEHPGRDTLPTSIFVCDKKGMVVLCGATTGYTGTLDLRYLWLGIRRLQGSHAASTKDAQDYIDILSQSKMTKEVQHIYEFEELAEVHQNLYKNNIGGGNIAINIGVGKDAE